MRVILFGDLHLDDGAALGEPDTRWGSSRTRDGIEALRAICAQDCDALVFLGDVARGPSPRPMIVRAVHDALAGSPARDIVLLDGNHDDSAGEAHNVLDVVAQGIDRAHVSHSPQLLSTDTGLQVGTLPWRPPQRLYGARASSSEANHAVATALVELAQGLATKLDGHRPSLLLAHWMLAGSNLASGSGLMQVSEPIVPVDDLEASGPWGAVVAGHNHLRQQLGARTWVCGPPFRHSFGEAGLPVGYLRVDFDGTRAQVTPVDLADRALLVVEVDVPAFLDGGALDLPDELDGAVVKLVGTCTDHDAERLAADGAHLTGEMIDACYLAGASKVVGPLWDRVRTERSRSDLTVESDPVAALEEWASREEGLQAHPDLLDTVLEHGRRIIAGQTEQVPV